MEIVNSGVYDRRFLTGNSCTEERARERDFSSDKFVAFSGRQADLQRITEGNRVSQ